MAEYYFKASRGDGTTLYLAPLTNRRIAACGQDLPKVSGHFLYEARDDDPDDIRVIAHVVAEDAIFELRHMLNLE